MIKIDDGERLQLLPFAACLSGANVLNGVIVPQLAVRRLDEVGN